MTDAVEPVGQDVDQEAADELVGVERHELVASVALGPVILPVNNGADMVESTIRMIDPNVSYSAVRASRGKVVRAEPVAALYEQRRIHHVGAFPTLEDQMCAFAPDFDRTSAGFSPDRVDALVWAFAELLVEPMSNEGYFEWARQKAASLKP